MRDDEPPPVARRASRPRYEYKVLSVKDCFVGGRADAKKIEETLNWYAAKGWRVVEAVSGTHGYNMVRDHGETARAC